jgi:integral membrane protein
MSPRALFRSFAVAEVVTWALLIGGMLLKYVARVGDWPVSIAGPIHGFVFLAYLVAGVVVAVNQRSPAPSSRSRPCPSSAGSTDGAG